MNVRRQKLVSGIAVAGAAVPVGHVMLGPSIIPPIAGAVGLLIAVMAGTYLLIARRRAGSDNRS